MTIGRKLTGIVVLSLAAGFAVAGWLIDGRARRAIVAQAIDEL